jgi:hypothetical protein
MKPATRETYATLKDCLSLRMMNLKEGSENRCDESFATEQMFQPRPSGLYFNPPYMGFGADFGGHSVYLS